jgi:hypothetical protein
MSTKRENNSENPEIDLLTVFSKIGDFFEWINTLLFRIIRFFVKNAIVVSFLIIVGVGIGFFLKKVDTSYEQKVMVAPNFKSTDYLYSKIDFLDSKIASRDTLFLKSIGIEKPSKIVDISIEPVIDIYNLINKDKDGKNLELLQLMAQNGDLKSIVKETTTSKNYELHAITINTVGAVSSKNIIEPILKYLNTSSYYDKYKKINLQNIQNSIKIKEATILQIDGILNRFTGTFGSHPNNEKLIYYNENLNLDKVIKNKDSLSDLIGTLKIEQYNTDKTIKDKGMVLNIKNSKSIKGKLIFILPLLFVGLFVCISFFISFYKKQLMKAKASLE